MCSVIFISPMSFIRGMSRFVFMGLLFVSFATFASEPTPQNTPTTTPKIPTAPKLPATPSQTVDFTLYDIQGKQHKLSDYRGKWVVVNYWATWCPPCQDEIPELIDFHEAHQAKNAVVLGVDFEDVAEAELKQFVEDYFMNYPILRMKPAARSELGVITGLPTTFLVSPTGVLKAQQIGPVTKKMIEDFIQEETGKALASQTP